MSWPQYMQGKRLVIFDEMNGNIDCALMKRLRGDDVLESRKQHSSKMDTQTITATMLLVGNEPPQCPKADKALSDSMIAYHMPAKGVHGAPDADPKQMHSGSTPTSSTNSKARACRSRWCASCRSTCVATSHAATSTPTRRGSSTSRGTC
jgi:hypothetical protein